MSTTTTTTTTTRPDPAALKVICLGLGRTGTSSLRDALAMIGFGPCYHMSVIMEHGGKDFPTWCKIGDGDNTAENFDTLLRGYGSVLDYPAAMYPAELYAAYPDAKFILTTRDPVKWEKSMRTTILRAADALRDQPNKSPMLEQLMHWNVTYLQGKYHRGRLHTHTQQELLDHEERVKRIIPSDKLLVYDVGEGWDRVVEFLGVPKPSEPFPHVNDLAQFQERVLKGFDYLSEKESAGYAIRREGG